MVKPGLKLKLPGAEMDLASRTHLMGVINVTPDSFSDGGLFEDQRAAIAQGLKLWREGADFLDVGGESTRPGSEPVEAAEEMRRVLPVIEELARATRAFISIDTTKAAVAKAAVEAGATVINDVTALKGDPEMPAVAAESGAAVVLMHMLGTPKTMQKDPRYGDVVAEVKAFLEEAARAAQAAGIERERIVVDPGIGFGKTIAHNLALIRRLGELDGLGYPVLLGASRKAFIGTLTGREPLERLWGTVGAHVAGALMGAHIVRVHEVAELKEALLVADAIARG